MEVKLFCSLLKGSDRTSLSGGAPGTACDSSVSKWKA